jgi:hypothetical protein
MRNSNQWEYYIAEYLWETTESRVLSYLSYPTEGTGYYVLRLPNLSDGEFTLEGGLDYMGKLGYELAAVQPKAMPIGGGGILRWLHPTYLYIFKKPVEV